MLVISLLTFLFFTTIVNFGDGDIQMRCRTSFNACAGLSILIMIASVVIGPSTMFHSMKGKHDRQALLLLPSSNFEKYLVRYLVWVLLLPLYAAALLLADVLQYAIHGMLGSTYNQLVVSVLADRVSTVVAQWSEIPSKIQFMLILILLWIHSWYALGATFFRSRKFSFIYATFVWIGLSVLLDWLCPNKVSLNANSTVMTCLYGAFWGVMIILNFWLSYRCFCRTQVIGKFVNF